MKCGKGCGKPVERYTGQPWLRVDPNKGVCHVVCSKRPRKGKQGRIAKPKAQHYGTNVDLQAMGEFRFQNGEPLTDEDSRTYKDGRQKFEGADYTARVREVLARDANRCQYKLCGTWKDCAGTKYWQICGAPADDAHHKTKRSKGRDDRAENLVSLCRRHHDEMHKEFQTQFRAARRAPGVGEGLDK